MTKAGGRGIKRDIEQLYYKDNITDVDDIVNRLHKKYRLKRQPCKLKVLKSLSESKRLKTNEAIQNSSTVTCSSSYREQDGNATSLNVNVELDDKIDNDIGGPRFKDLGGMNQVVELLKKKVLFPLFHPKLTQRLGVSPISGILLHGPPGCGKTTLAHAIANEIGVPFYKIVATELVSGVSGASEENIRELFSKAYRTAPSIVFIDEIDAIASKRENLQREMERRIVTQLMACMDESNRMVPQHEKDASSKDSVCRPGYVLVIGATNRPDAVDAALRRPGRFDREIVLGVPDETARVEILSVLTSKLEVEGDFDLLKLARCTPGFVGADLAALANEAGNLAMERIIDQRKSELSIESLNEENTEEWWRHPWSPEEEEKLYITMGDFEEAAKMVQPSSRREGFNSIPIVNWEDVGGLDSLTKEFEQHIIRRIKHPEDYEEFGVHLETGFLLYGPPGCGKTLIAKAVANEAGANFIHIKGPELLNKYVGESELAVRRIFSRARTCSPCILFFDEVDALTTKRGKEGGWVVERVLNQLLIELDGAEQRRGVYVIGATNRPEVIDRALLRPGRLGELIYVPLPSPDERGLILKALSKKKPIDATVDLVSFGKNDCKNLSGADLAALMDKAAMAALEDKWQEVQNSDETQYTIKAKHFDQALKKVRPSVSCEQIKNYMRFQKSFTGVYGAMAQQPIQGVSATDAKEIERLSAKESLLLAFKDAGGFDALVAGTTTDFQRIDVNERITSLERLNPTPRPTTSPFLEGRWNFEWLGTGTPGLFASKIAFESIPSSLANLSKMDVLIKDGNAKITAQLKLLNSIECKFILSAKLSVEGPLRMKEEYILESPTIDELTIPEQLRGAFGQAATTMQQLPVPIRDALTHWLKVPLSGSYQRLFMISYLDEEILIIRDSAGIPEVLTRLDTHAETM